jgi:hypothetical protein
METLIKLTDEELQEIFDNKDYVSLEDFKDKILDYKNEISRLEEKIENDRENYRPATPKEMGWE